MQPTLSCHIVRDLYEQRWVGIGVEYVPVSDCTVRQGDLEVKLAREEEAKPIWWVNA